ncbi:MAG TPA: hypothetical protein VHF58_10095 [Solirubrobacterales bacterium]|nr:hypothetical protein [Solirubrobacterales bacterium]
MYRSTFSHLNISDELPAEAARPVQTIAKRESRRSRRGSPRPRRRLALGLARLAHGGSSSP